MDQLVLDENLNLIAELDEPLSSPRPVFYLSDTVVRNWLSDTS